MRTQFLEVETAEEAETVCPWACRILAADGGWWCFESASDAAIWEAQA